MRCLAKVEQYTFLHICSDETVIIVHSLIINVHASKRDCVPLAHANVSSSDA